MYDYILEEMADAIANELHVDNNDVLRILNRYWQDKIAHVWQVDDMLECARNAGKPITRTDAAGAPAQGLRRSRLRAGHQLDQSGGCLAGVSLVFKRLPAEQYNEVHGCLQGLAKGQPHRASVRTVPRQDGLATCPKPWNLQRSMADEMPNVPVLIGL